MEETPQGYTSPLRIAAATAAAAAAAALAAGAFPVAAQAGGVADEAVAAVRATPLHRLAEGFGRADASMTLEDYLVPWLHAAERVRWEVDDCGEGTGNPDSSRGDLPRCVTAYVELPDGRRFTVVSLAPTAGREPRLRSVWWDSGAGWEPLDSGMRQLTTLLMSGGDEPVQRVEAPRERPLPAGGASLAERLRAALLSEVDSLGGYEVAHLETTIRPGGTAVSLLTYARPAGDWPYGHAIVLWREGGDSVAALWFRLFPGTAPHALHWRDFDGDGREDLFFTAGFEDLEQTYLFLERMTEAEGTPGAMHLAFSDDADYATVVDLDGDGRPEILDPLEPDAPYGSASECRLSEAGRDEGAARYRALASGFAPLNRYRTLYPLRPVRILRLERAETGIAYSLEDVTDRYPEHLRWRRRLWSATEPAWPGASCRERLDLLEAWATDPGSR